MVADRSTTTDPAPGWRRAPRRPLLPGERLCIAGAAVAVASMFLPWYGIAFSGGLAVTGFDSFGFAHAALVLTVAAAAGLCLACAAGFRLPRPLRESALVSVAGGWAALLVVYLIVDRPEQLAGSTRIDLRLGVFVALGGALAVLVAGLRMRDRPGDT